MNEQEELKQYGRLVAQAWGDPAFKERLLADPEGTLREHGFDVPADMQVRVLEPSAERIYLPLPAAMPDAEQPDAWVELWRRARSEPAFKARLLAEPTAVLAEQGVLLPAGVPVEVVETSDTQGYIALPPAPEELDADALDDVAGYFSCCGVVDTNPEMVGSRWGGTWPRFGYGDVFVPMRTVVNDTAAAFIHRPISLKR